MEFVGDLRYIVFDAEILTIGGVLVILGGLFNALRAIGFLVCGIFSYWLFYASLIWKLFHFKANSKEKAIQKKKRLKKKKNTLNDFDNDNFTSEDESGDDSNDQKQQNK